MQIHQPSVTGSLEVTGSIVVTGSTTISGSLYNPSISENNLSHLTNVKVDTASGAFFFSTGSPIGPILSSDVIGPFGPDSILSASYAVSSSHEIIKEVSSSHADQADTASFITGSNVYGPFGSNSIISASYAITASHALETISASYAVSASYVNYANSAGTAVSSSHAINSDNSISASHALNSDNSISSSYAITASHALEAVSASYVETSSFITGSNVYGPFGSNSIMSASYALTASYLSGSSDSASYSLTSSYALTASHFEGIIESASYASQADTASFITGSNVHGPFGSNSILSASYAVTASHALSASYAPSDTDWYEGSTYLTASKDVYITGSLSVEGPISGTATLTVGNNHSNTTNLSSIAGGSNNKIADACGFIGGGGFNTVCGPRSFIGGGNGNTAVGENSSIAGGGINTIMGTSDNNLLAFNSIVGGCRNSIISGSGGFVGGGYCNEIQAGTGTGLNRAYAKCSVILGGFNNKLIPSSTSTAGSINHSGILGGSSNTICVGASSGRIDQSTIVGGLSNTISHGVAYGAILGGCNNNVQDDHSFIIGSNLTSDTRYTTFVNNLNISGSLKDSDGNIGTNGQVLSSNGTGKIAWTTGGGGGSDDDWYNGGTFLTSSRDVFITGSGRLIIGNRNDSPAMATTTIGSENINCNPAGFVVGNCNESHTGFGYPSYILGTYNIICNYSENNSILGGNSNGILGGNCSTIAGGYQNTINRTGTDNTSVEYGFIGGGFYNTLRNHQTGDINSFSSVVGGCHNDITGSYSFIGGGSCNHITDNGDFGGILGGCENILNHERSFIIGSNLESSADCTTFTNNLNASGSLSITGPTITTGSLTTTQGDVNFHGCSATALSVNVNNNVFREGANTLNGTYAHTSFGGGITDTIKTTGQTLNPYQYNLTEGYNGITWSTLSNTNYNERVWGRATGTTTSALLNGGSRSFSNTNPVTCTEVWDGSTWSSGVDTPYGAQAISSFGNNSNSINLLGGNCGTTIYNCNIEWNGTSWNVSTVLPKNLRGMGAAGTPSAGVVFQGLESFPTGYNQDYINWNGVSWNTGVSRTQSTDGGAAYGGTVTSAWTFGTNGNGFCTTVYDGTSYYENTSYSGLSNWSYGSGTGPSGTNGLGISGRQGNGISRTFEYTSGESSAVHFDNSTSQLVFTAVSASGHYVDDAAAATGGVPLGGIYRNGNFIAIRLT